MNAGTGRGQRAAWIVLLAGVAAALHIAKLPPAIPVLQRELGVTLVQAGFLLALVQLAGMIFGVAAGLVADGFGLRRSMLVGLAVLSVASFAGGFAQNVETLLLLRAVEGLGFLTTTVPAPSLIRRCVAPAELTRMLGFWGAFMPFGTALALLAGPKIMEGVDWQGWWWLVALISCAALVAVYRVVPDDGPRESAQAQRGVWRVRLGRTLMGRGPWLAAFTFAVYSAQWLALIGFLPSLYQAIGWTGLLGAALTALVAGVNMVGNIAAGHWLARGVGSRVILWCGFAAMGVGSFLAFSGLTEGVPLLRYLGALIFSLCGGLIPGTLFALAPRLAPGSETVSTTVGWMMQWSAIGQFSGPPLVAWMASRLGTWQWSWVFLGLCSLAGMGLAWLVGRRLAADVVRR